MQGLPGVGRIGNAPGLAQRLDEEEAEGRQTHDDGVGCQFALGEQLGLILAHMFGTQLVGSPVEVPGEILNGVKVRPRCTLREVKTLEFLEHHFAKTGHRDLLSCGPYNISVSGWREGASCNEVRTEIRGRLAMTPGNLVSGPR